jgi:hypothetical protein
MGELNMENKNLSQEIYQLNSALSLLKSDKQREKLSYVLGELGITEKETREVTAFLLNEVSIKEYKSVEENEAVMAYVRAFTRVQKQMEMAKGYQDMGEINKGIANEMVHLEEEGERLTDEMVSEDTKEQA